MAEISLEYQKDGVLDAGLLESLQLQRSYYQGFIAACRRGGKQLTEKAEHEAYEAAKKESKKGGN
jgi:hypothetical protein